MALIACPECSREISDKVKSCPHCGYPLVEENDDTQKVEVTSVNLKMEEGKKKKLVTYVIGIVVVALIAFGGYSMYRAQQSEKMAAEYSSNIDLLLAEMLNGGSKAEGLMNLTAKVWYNAIYEESDSETDQYTKKYGYWVGDFNDALAYLFADTTTKTTVDSIKSSQDNVSAIMKMLQNPPKEYEKVYETISDLYSAYQGITDLAMDPKGNLSSFSTSKSDKIDKFMELYKRAETQLPEKSVKQ